MTKITADPRLHWYAGQLKPSTHQPTGVVDGDTINAVVDLGAFIYIQKPIRMFGINAPEMATPDGKAAKTWAIAWFQTHCPDGLFVFNSALDPEGKYGRLLGTVYAPDGACFNVDAVTTGHAVVYLP